MEIITELLNQLSIEHGIGAAMVPLVIAIFWAIAKRTDNKIDDKIVEIFQKHMEREKEARLINKKQKRRQE